MYPSKPEGECGHINQIITAHVTVFFRSLANLQIKHVTIRDSLDMILQ